MPSASETNGSNGNGVVNGNHAISNGGTNGDVKKTNGVNSRILHIPDLFDGILSGDPVENPLEPSIGPLSEAWTKALTKMDPKTAKILTKANFAYLISLSAPQADAEAFRMAVDWCIWAFVFDDQYDEGEMKDKTIESAHEMIYTLSLMDDSYPPVDPKKYPLRYMFQSTWHRFQQRNPAPDLQQRWKETHRKCLYAILQQVWLAQSNTGLDVAIPDYMATRRQSIGSYCLFVVVEWAHGIKLTQDIMDHPSIATCERAAADLTWLVNDVLSYKKDLGFGVEHNLICLLKRQGLSEQQAMDRTGEIMNQCQKDWDDAVANLPSWGEETDKEVQRYLGACRDVARANLWWSFKSGRYLNAEEAIQARTARILTL
ncbi:isoprenoid synthase domain-containing protein [Xylaria bambusicola]|uniref:isoprenoid synthase domain-containing protein n=1 Tax=Xylaria bambusicola TaxID=326684 RepID=UPI002008D781|nr:isoprenoid synthase domain-containing protein [Xylaria bambusicola]KAI0514695.1 isoprenoid synthase domain-containing protein [Xylaria bambusicola]